MTDYVMVLNDGETYTTLAGCKIFEIDDDDTPETIEQKIESSVLPELEFDVLNGKPFIVAVRPITIEFS